MARLRPHRLLAVLPPLTKGEKEQLVERVRLYGQREAIEILDGEIVAGLGEYEACVAAKVTPRLTEIEEPPCLVEYVVRRNVPQHMSSVDRGCVAVLAYQEAAKAAGRARMREGGRVGGASKGRAGSARAFEEGERWYERAAAIVGVRPGLVRTLAEIHRQAPDVFAALRARRTFGSLSTAKELIKRVSSPKERMRLLDRYEARNHATPFRYVIFDHLREERIKALPLARSKGSRFAVHEGDFRKKGREIPDGSVDAIVADIIYGDVEMAGDVAKLAARVLVQGGVLALMAGNEEGHAIINACCAHMRLVTIGAIALQGTRGATPGRSVVRADSLPVYLLTNASDVAYSIQHLAFTSEGVEKTLHRWQKSLGATSDLVQSIAPRGSRILDPCCGSGTTGEAALRHGCEFIGIDLDHDAVTTSRARLMKVERELATASADRPSGPRLKATRPRGARALTA